MKKDWPTAVVQTLPDQVAQMILARIAAGELSPGHRLPAQRDLAQSMGVGLAVIREAIQRLAALNVVEASHGSGTVVRNFRWMPLIYDPTMFQLAMQRIGILDLWEARRLLEGQIIRLAAERATQADLDAMHAILERAKPLPTDYEASLALNREFHIALARAGRNAVLVDLLEPLLDVRTEGAGRRFSRDISGKTWEAHQRIYRAVLSRDLKQADKAIHFHFGVGPIALAEIDERTLAARQPAAGAATRETAPVPVRRRNRTET